MVLTFIAGMIETYVRVNPRFWVFPLGIHRGSLITIATPQDFFNFNIAFSMHNLSCFTEISTSLELKHSREAISAIESYSICFHSEILCVDVNMFDSINAGV